MEELHSITIFFFEFFCSAHGRKECDAELIRRNLQYRVYDEYDARVRPVIPRQKY